MELGNRIKMYRQEAKLSQEELADRVYVSRQTISNWENDKCYPDVHSLVLLGEIFHVSLDKLIKGDIDVMKEAIQKEEVKKLKRYQGLTALLAGIMVILTMPLVSWIGIWSLIPMGMLIVVMLYCMEKGLKIEKDNDLQNFREIMAFLNGRKMDDAEKQKVRAQAEKNRVFRDVISILAGVVIAVGGIYLGELLLELVKRIMN